MALLLVGATVFLAVALGDPLELLERPTDSALRFVDRRVLLDAALREPQYAALAQLARWSDPAAGSLDPTAAAALLEDVRRFDGPSTDLLGCTAAMHAAGGNLDEVRAIVERLRDQEPQLGAAIAWAWLAGDARPPSVDVWRGAAGPACRNMLANAVAERNDDEATIARLAVERDETVARLAERASGLAMLRFGLVALGLLTWLGWLACGRRGTRVAAALVEDAWPPALGTVVLVRGGFWAVVITLLLFGLDVATETPILPLSMPALVAALPLFGLVQSRLLRPQRCGFLRAFGLRPRPSGLVRAVLWTLPVFAFDQIGRIGIEHAGHALGIVRHWTEYFAEDFIWGGSTVVFAAALNLVAWVPLAEEVAFRGVLYGTLRNRVGPGTATLLSAALFATFHLAMTAFAPFVLCTAVGLASAFWGGLVWAVAYERTRSLIPGLLAHVLANLLPVAGNVVLFG